MIPHPFTEDRLVEKPAIELFEQLGWQRLDVSKPEALGA